MNGTLSAELVIDVGNTRMKWAVFDHGRLTATGSAAHGDLPALESAVDGRPLRRITLGSVARPDESLARSLAVLAPVKEITGASPSPVHSRYATPSTFGVDRLANVAGAASLFPRRPVLAIDLGTCTTYDLVDGLAVHQGGIISPGLHMRAQAMHAYSARLPLVDPPAETPVLGTTTATSLAAGSHHGLLMELGGFIAAFRQQHRHLAVVLTGGDALRAARALKSGIFAHPTLTLIGLHALSHYDPDNRPAAHS